MKTSIVPMLVYGMLLAMPLISWAQGPMPESDMVLIRATMKSPDQVVDAIKSYSEEKKWMYMGANKAKQGEVTMIKVCVPEVAQLLWPVGLHLSALLPCGNFGVYRKENQTEISMLHPRYMQVLYPHAEVEKAVKVATPLFTEMLATVAK
ncbi:MAG: hypothetical protein JWR25_378 [Noviherbaspirillum sp.]|jgi:hypothetical protein|nr:hypothetical protein [Noviherbaspirillum sp.]